MSRRVLDEGGSVVVGFGLVSVLVVLMLLVVAVGSMVATHAAVATAADAAALGAAPVTFRPFGASGSAADEAKRLAAANGARLISCVCRADSSWAERTVTVTVARSARIPLVGPVTVTGRSRASFDPALLLLGEPGPR